MTIKTLSFQVVIAAFVVSLHTHHATGEVTYNGPDSFSQSSLNISTLDTLDQPSSEIQWEPFSDIHCIGYQKIAYLITIDTNDVYSELYEIEDRYDAQAYRKEDGSVLNTLVLLNMHTEQVWDFKLEEFDDPRDSTYSTSVQSYR